MALKGTRSTTLSYTSMVGDSVAAHLSAAIPEKGTPNRSVNISDYELYKANKEACRADIDEFNRLVDSIEDSMA